MILVIILVVLVASYVFCGLRETEREDIEMIGNDINRGQFKKKHGSAKKAVNE